MSNSDAIAYAQVALITLKKNNYKITLDNLYGAMNEMFDLFSEDSIHDELLCLTDYECWKAKHDIN